MDRKALDEIARRSDALEHDDSRDHEFIPVKAKVIKPVGVIYSTRYSGAEIELIRQAAEQQGTTTSAFIRAAALAAAAGTLDLTAAEKVTALQDAQAKARELAEVLQHL